MECSFCGVEADEGVENFGVFYCSRECAHDQLEENLVVVRMV